MTRVRQIVVARYVLRITGAIGMLVGLTLICAVVVELTKIWREDLVIAVGSILICVVLLALGAYLTYISYLLLWWLSLVAVRPLCFLLGLACFLFLASPLEYLAETIAAKGWRMAASLLGVAPVIVAFLIYFTVTKGLLKLGKIAGRSLENGFSTENCLRSSGSQNE